MGLKTRTHPPGNPPPSTPLQSQVVQMALKSICTELLKNADAKEPFFKLVAAACALNGVRAQQYFPHAETQRLVRNPPPCTPGFPPSSIPGIPPSYIAQQYVCHAEKQRLVHIHSLPLPHPSSPPPLSVSSPSFASPLPHPIAPPRSVAALPPSVCAPLQPYPLLPQVHSLDPHREEAPQLPLTASSDGFMINLGATLLQLCEPFTAPGSPHAAKIDAT